MWVCGVLYARSRVRFPGVTSNPSIDFFPFRVAFSSVRLGTDGEERREGKGGRGREGKGGEGREGKEGRGKEGVK